MLTLHIANKNYSSWSLRPWILMRELEIPFEEKLHVFAGANNWEEFRLFSPSGTVPCLHDGDTKIWDTLAIIEYLAEQYPEVWPEHVVARAWARCASAEMHSSFSALRNVCNFNCGIRMALHEISSALEKDISRLDELWNDGLGRFGGPFLAGSQFTAVDAFFAPVAFRIQTYGIELSEESHGYAGRLLELPAMKEWYASALDETWRDPDHEKEILLNGTIKHDLRQI